MVNKRMHICMRMEERVLVRRWMVVHTKGQARYATKVRWHPVLVMVVGILDDVDMLVVVLITCCIVVDDDDVIIVMGRVVVAPEAVRRTAVTLTLKVRDWRLANRRLVRDGRYSFR